MAFKIRQGDEIVVSLPVIENGVTVPITTAISIKTQLLINNVPVKTYSLTPNIGEGLITVDPLNTHIAKIFIERADSINFQKGVGTFYMLVEFENTEFPDGGQCKSYQFVGGNGLLIQEGFARDLDMP